jgi:hypothetical protein
VGLVFPEEELASAASGAVRNERGEMVPFEAEPTGWWSPEKKSVKWLLLHFRASTDRHYFFEPGGEPRRPEGPPLATVDATGWRIATGPLAVRLAQGSGRLFEEVTLNGKSGLEAAGPTPVLVTDDGACTLGEWTVALEQNSPARAVVKAGGFFLDAKKTKIARLDVRMEFFQGEGFVRLHHTLTWMVKDTRLGVRELSLRLAPRVTGASRGRVGLSDFMAESFDVPGRDGARIAAFQDGPEHFGVTSDGRELKSGRHLGGWFALEDADGRSADEPATKRADHRRQLTRSRVD